LARELHAPLVLVYVDSPVEVLIQRHAANRDHQRRMDVTDAILHEHLASFESSTPDEDPVRYVITDGDFDETLRQIRHRLSVAGDASPLQH
jgi:predicted kinase